ncbi:hypothetical protein [Volucribacter amazonae]|uniref:Uncharacterized protein n=1 Tax=Volucribacter amazonae TaxID=256731 RepID=A0A9X4SIV1_9PAST|nr:hypothetical protein [Volucribacter amazonae]MDG6896070.1 hypothetical protein [Volucribacter amazonae]
MSNKFELVSREEFLNNENIDRYIEDFIEREYNGWGILLNEYICDAEIKQLQRKLSKLEPGLVFLYNLDKNSLEDLFDSLYQSSIVKIKGGSKPIQAEITLMNKKGETVFNCIKKPDDDTIKHYYISHIIRSIRSFSYIYKNEFKKDKENNYKTLLMFVHQRIHLLFNIFTNSKEDAIEIIEADLLHSIIKMGNNKSLQNIEYKNKINDEILNYENYSCNHINSFLNEIIMNMDKTIGDFNHNEYQQNREEKIELFKLLEIILKIIFLRKALCQK